MRVFRLRAVACFDRWPAAWMASPQSRGRVCWTDGEKQGEWLVDFLDPYDGNIEFCTLNRSFLGLDVVHITPLGENGQEADPKEVERYEKRLEEVRIATAIDRASKTGFARVPSLESSPNGRSHAHV